MTPRLLDVHMAAEYMSVHPDTVRGLVAAGKLTPVRMPSSRNKGELSRRLLFDRQDLDRVIDEWKAASTASPNEQLSKAALKGWRQTPHRKTRGAA